MPTTREVDAARAERQRRAAEQRATEEARRPGGAAGRRTARAEAAHARAVALKGPRWSCHVRGCAEPGPHPAPSVEAAERAAMRHYDRVHYVAVPAWADDWQAAGRPRLDGWLARWLAAHPDTPTARPRRHASSVSARRVARPPTPPGRAAARGSARPVRRACLTPLGPGPNVLPMTNTTAALLDYSDDHLRRTLYTEAGRMMHTEAELDAYRAELDRRTQVTR